ncbi:MAG: carbon storage regulator CsrA [Myxococcales bacterium]|nr:carbon storage regulator CsrA [Myxococcales bacterium]
MLVLTRKARETLRIGGEVRVTVLSVSGGQVRIGIEAPSSVAIHREEVFSQIESANRRAARVESSDFPEALRLPSLREKDAGSGAGEEDDSSE